MLNADRIVHGLDGDLLHELYSPPEIQKRVSAMARELSSRFRGEPTVAVCVLRGAVFFFSDLVRQLQIPDLKLDFVGLSSYGAEQESSGRVDVTRWLSLDVADANVIIVEDIVDTGLSMRTLMERLNGASPRSCTLCALIDKTAHRTCKVDVDYACFRVSDGFFVGYGLDFAQKYRHFPGIYELERSEQ
ncbi:MAG: hypoxanthine phosphoribosyltransferase [Desulfovibrio sp.]|nr:hypoxanthine phosphoribosyltransferase [Desulfovibrio sp.]